MYNTYIFTRIDEDNVRVLLYPALVCATIDEANQDYKRLVKLYGNSVCAFVRQQKVADDQTGEIYFSYRGA